MAGLLPERTGETAVSGEGFWTWRIDWENKRLDGMIDGMEALGQSLLLALLTPRFAHVIYSFAYGSELESLIGRDRDYALAAAPALAEECVKVDNRVTEAWGRDFVLEGDHLSGVLQVKGRQGETVLQVRNGNGGRYGHSKL